MWGYYSLAREFAILLCFRTEMKKILIFVVNAMVCIGFANAAVRDGTAVSRNATNNNVQVRSATNVKRDAARAVNVGARNVVNGRNTAKNVRAASTQTTPVRTTVARSARDMTVTERASVMATARATVAGGTMADTRVGAEYERCKETYFSCMDQFCTLKNDDYRRCSCNDRVFDLMATRDVLQDAGEQLTIFTENLDVVGMTAQQAAAMRAESEGESALTSDSSASKALLQAIMNSIRGDDANVSGKYSALNSVNLSFDTANAFGVADAGQAIAAYNGVALYNAVYPQCRNAVRADCTDAALQRAITAYLMAIEQDCNTVQAAINQTQKQMKGAVREGSAMLDLARVENRQKHNSSDVTSCINAVEEAILSEQVCGAHYHKCLDNGEFIDVSTGAPIAGIEDFYKLENMLVFSDGVDAVYQKLAKNSANRVFVQNFESRVKKFAEPALDKCVENADEVWAEYLDKAMLDIYYAQRDKVKEIKQGCFDFISACYTNSDTAITSAMKALGGDSVVVLQPNKIALSSQMCKDYITSCDNMFDNNIIAEYVENQQQTDMLTACRAVVKQCFDKYGGMNYENFYYPYSGLFKTGSALDWFTLYDYEGGVSEGAPYKSECAKQLQDIAACSDPEMIEQAFGGFDVVKANVGATDDTVTFVVNANGGNEQSARLYGTLYKQGGDTYVKHRFPRSTGVATEVYNQVVSILGTQCMNLHGRFVELQFIKSMFKTCSVSKQDDYLKSGYGVFEGENMCPRDYALGVDTESWGACLCWENGGRRSKNGTSARCVAELPIVVDGAGYNAYDGMRCGDLAKLDTDGKVDAWCTQNYLSDKNQLCPYQDGGWKDCEASVIGVPEGIE